jgi:hypothetical protein
MIHNSCILQEKFRQCTNSILYDAGKAICSLIAGFSFLLRTIRTKDLVLGRLPFRAQILFSRPLSVWKPAARKVLVGISEEDRLLICLVKGRSNERPQEIRRKVKNARCAACAVRRPFLRRQAGARPVKNGQQGH